MKISPARPSDRRVQTVCLLILTLIATAWALEQLQPVLVPFVLAIFFSQCLTPLIDYLMRRFRWPQMVAVSVAALAGAAIVGGVGFLLASSIAGMSDKGTFKTYFDHFQSQIDSFVNSPEAHRFGIRPGGTSDQILRVVNDKGYDLFTFLGGSMLTILKNTVTVLILMAFILFGRRRNPLRREGILDEIELRVQRYISLSVFISVLTGLMVGASLSILGVQFAAGFGFLAFLLNFIPNVGAVVATILPLPLVFLDPHLSLLVKVMAVVIPSVVQVGIGLIQPRMMGQSLDLHPVVVLLSLLFFAMIWNLPGAFLATPLTAVIKIIFEKIPATRPLAAVLAGNLDPLAETIDDTPIGEEEI
jgi:AI-2 transport protein TqsA